MDFYEACSYLNDLTEHRHGLGPIEDGGRPRTEAIKTARALGIRFPESEIRRKVEQAVAVVNGGVASPFGVR